MPTTNMSLNEPSVGQTAGPDWATEVNANFTTIDQHDHTSGKGVQLTPSALNINSDLEFNGNAATELKRLTIDSSATGSGTNYSVYQSGGNLYWYNGSGQAVQITNGANVKTTGGSIDGMESTDAGADYGSGYFKWEFDTTKTPFAGAKMKNADIELHKYDGASGSNAYVILKYTGSSEGSNNITVPDETGQMLTSSTSYGGNISIAATGGSNTITLDAEGNINLDSNSGIISLLDNADTYGQFKQDSSNFEIHVRNDSKDIIFKQYDGNEVVRMADDRRLYFFDKGGEYIVGDGTDLTVASGGALNLTATTDVVVPANVGITFGTGEKIEGDNTDLTLTSGAAINLNAGTLDLSAQTVDVTLNGAVDALNFDSNTLSIDASNNRVGVGTAAPGSKFEVRDDVAGDANLVTLKNLSSNSGLHNADFYMNFATTGGTEKAGVLLRASKSADWASSANEDSELSIYTRKDGTSTKQITINKDGNLKINNAGCGIDFYNYGTGTDISSNLLDDYEEGTWAANFNGPGQTGGTIVSSTENGRYTKIGNLVTVHGQFQQGDGQSSANLQLAGLPFTSASNPTDGDTVSFGAVKIYNQSIPSSTNGIVAQMQVGKNHVEFIGNVDSGAITTLQRYDDGYVAFTITYTSA